MSEKVRADFEEMRIQLRKLKDEYCPQGGNLHFDGLIKVDAALFHELLKLSRRAIEIVKDDDQRYSNMTAYAHTMHDFWYECFLLISSASLRVMNSSKANEIPNDVIVNIIDDLIYISSFSIIVAGDLTFRNGEALGNTLLAFHSSDMTKHIKNIRKTIDIDSDIKRFLDGIVKRVKKIQKDSI